MLPLLLRAVQRLAEQTLMLQSTKRVRVTRRRHQRQMRMAIRNNSQPWLWMTRRRLSWLSCGPSPWTACAQARRRRHTMMRFRHPPLSAPIHKCPQRPTMRLAARLSQHSMPRALTPSTPRATSFQISHTSHPVANMTSSRPRRRWCVHSISISSSFYATQDLVWTFGFNAKAVGGLHYIGAHHDAESEVICEFS